MEITPATVQDLEDCQAIYAHHVLHGTGSFDELPPSLEELTAIWRAITGAGHPYIIARDASGVLGFGSYSQYRNRSAYRFAAEDSVYVRETVRGQGVGKALVTELLAHAAKTGFTQMLAVIGDSENTGSIGVHASLGFSHIGTLRKVGFKLNRWLDVVIMQKPLAP